MRLNEHFHWLVPQTVATQVAGQMLRCAILKKLVATVAESRTRFYFPQKPVSATGFATFLAVARYVILGNDSCNLSRNALARQVAGKISQFNSAFRTAQRKLHFEDMSFESS